VPAAGRGSVTTTLIGTVFYSAGLCEAASSIVRNYSDLEPHFSYRAVDSVPPVDIDADPFRPEAGGAIALIG
jgi:hypothetical protein